MVANDLAQLSVSLQEAGTRVDVYIANNLPHISRSMSAQLIRQGLVRIDGEKVKPGHKIKAREQVTIQLPPPEPVELAPEPIPLNILFEDSHLLVINKSPGLVVHPAAGHDSGTLVNGILHHCPDLEGVGGRRRPGIVHRLDKDTSGAIVVAKTDRAHHELSHQFKTRSVEKRYLALIIGVPEQSGGRIDLPVGRHPVQRKKMSTLSHRGRQALTIWRIKERFGDAALLEVDLKTGRTHQIRVHCRSMGHPLVGDRTYGFKKRRSGRSENDSAVHQIIDGAGRHMLHAERLRFTHPASGERITCIAPLPQDMARIIEQLRLQTGDSREPF